jgi:hypothetical protein
MSVLKALVLTALSQGEVVFSPGTFVLLCQLNVQQSMISFLELFTRA